MEGENIKSTEKKLSKQVVQSKMSRVNWEVKVAVVTPSYLLVRFPEAYVSLKLYKAPVHSTHLLYIYYTILYGYTFSQIVYCITHNPPC